MKAANWATLPFEGERLESVVFFGNGKDAELQLTLAGGRRATLPVSAVRVEVDRGGVVDTSRWDDVSVLIKYLGDELRLCDGRFGYLDDDDGFGAEFLAAAQSWLAAGCAEEMSWVVEVELRLASSQSDLYAG